MKVLYVGHFYDGSGFSQAAINWALALDAVGVDVVCRPFRLNDHRGSIPERILELEAKDSRGCDVCIQHTLPAYFSYNGRFQKNIGLFVCETNNFRSSGWAERANTMDEIWVGCWANKFACRDSGVDIPVHVIPHAANVSKYQANYVATRGILPNDPLGPVIGRKAEGEFLFYTIGEAVRRKNLAALVRAFHAEFDTNEPVRLVIKTSLPGKAPQETAQHIAKFCDEVRTGLRIRKTYRSEIVITDRLSDHDILVLHQLCDVFVQPSYGESWSQPSFDSMAMGKTPIVTDGGGYIDYMNNNCGWLVESRPEPCFAAFDTLEGLYTADEAWRSVDISQLRRAMRESYEKQDVRAEKSRKGIERAAKFGFPTVGASMKKLLGESDVQTTEIHQERAVGRLPRVGRDHLATRPRGG